MQKTLIIGIGGTGLTTIREIRRLIAERYEQGLKAPEVASTKFVYIDTDEGDVKSHTWSVLGESIELADGEKIIINGNDLKPYIDTPEHYPNISPWLPRISDYIGEPGDGAKGIRPYGRLIYEYTENKQAIKQKIVDCYTTLNESFRQITDWRFYLVCGLSGGTGSGMFLPLSFNLLDWDIYQKGQSNRKFYSFLVLPPLAITGRHNRYRANAYAALSELNYHAFQSPPLPYNNCYLLEPKNAQGLEIGLSNLPLLIAQRIFLNIQGGTASTFIDSMMDNPQLGTVGGDLASNRKHSLRFSTFGLATVSYPREVISQCLAYYLSEKVVSAWIAQRDYRGDINQQVQNELQAVHLSFLHICGDADPFERNDHLAYKTEIENLVDEKLQGVNKGQLGEKITRIRQEIEKGFRGKGIQEFYAQRQRDIAGASKASLQQIRIKLTAFLCNPQLGIKYGKQFLDELIKILNDFNGKFNEMVSEAMTRKIDIFRENLNDTLNQVRIEEKKLTYFKFQRDRAALSDELKSYLKSVAEQSAGRYGLDLLQQIIPQVRRLRSDLDLWENRMKEIQQTLASKLQQIMEDLQNGTTENGRTIFDTQGLKNLVQDIDPSVIQASVEEILKTSLKQSDLDLIALTSNTPLSPESVVYEASYKWVLSPSCPVDVKRLTLFDKFISEYGDSAKRQAILREAKNLSAPFLYFVPSEIGKNPQLANLQTIAEVTTIPDGIGRITPQGQPAQQVIQQDLESVGIPRNKIKIADDQERIIFLQEKQAFPLRFIDSLLKLKAEYETFSDKSVLHIDRQLEGQLYDLYLLSPQEQQERLDTEQTFIIARVYGWLKQTTNQSTRQSEIRYEFEESGKIGTKKLVLGTGIDWEAARNILIDDVTTINPKNAQVREVRQRLTQKAKILRQQLPASPDSFEEMQTLFQKYLAPDDLLKYPAGIDDPRYERDQNIINSILDSIN